MEKFVMVEVGSTTTKAYLYEKGEVKRIGFEVIEFKNDYKKENKITIKDKKLLFNFIASIKEDNIFVYGTSIFRNLDLNERNSWLKEFRDVTGLEFNIVTADMENEYTVYGAIANVDYKGKIAVMIGGGGSTELAIVENGKIIEKVNSSFGAMDITDKFPDLKDDYAKTNFKEMVIETKKLVNKVKNKADLLILAGGDYIYFYEELEFSVNKNNLYVNDLQPYLLSKDEMDKFDNDFFYHVSLKEVIKKSNNEAWWKGARGMRLCVKALADILEVRYIVPTRITCVYGIVEKIKGEE